MTMWNIHNLNMYQPTYYTQRDYTFEKHDYKINIFCMVTQPCRQKNKIGKKNYEKGNFT